MVGAKPVICSKVMNKIRHDEGVYTVPINKHKEVANDGKITQWDGVSIEMVGDFNDHQDGKWSAVHVPGHDNMMLVTEPALPRSMISPKSKVMHDLDAEQSVIEGRDIAMTAHKKAFKGHPTDDAVSKRKHLVVFPDNMKLSNKPFHSDEFKEDANMDPEVNIDYVVTHVRSSTGWQVTLQVSGNDETHDVFTFSSWIKWRFVDLNTQIDIADPKKKKKATVDKLGTLDKFESMNIGSDEEDDDDDGLW